MPKVLVIEDNLTLAENVQSLLESENFTVDLAADGADGLKFLKAFEYDLVVLDWQLPEVSGVDLLQQYRRSGGRARVLMLTGMGEIEDKERGFECGADDFLTKPYEARELIARVKALMKRSLSYVDKSEKIGPYRIDLKARRLFKDNVEIHLKPLEFGVLEFLVRRQNEVLSFNAIASNVWPSDNSPSNDAIYSCMKNLRKKLGLQDDQESIIRTVHGTGYMLINPDDSNNAQ